MLIWIRPTATHPNTLVGVQVTEQMSQIKKLKRMQTLTENLEKHEAAFRKIQMASGLHTADEIIQNYTNREKILRAVKSKVDVLQTQLTKAQERHDRAKTDLDAEKYEATPGRGAARSFSWQIGLAYSAPLFLLVFFIFLRSDVHRVH